MIKSNLVEQSLKPTADEWDWDSFLGWLWKSDNARNWKVYSTEQAGHYWDGRTSVRERLR